MVRQWQELFNERRYSFVDIQSPDFVTCSRAATASPANAISRHATELQPAPGAEMLNNHDGSFLLEVSGYQREQRVPDGAAGMQRIRDKVKIRLKLKGKR
jgi:thiamine pyrophosphate-dependent acetolactate synthase large subunit-like protein